MRYLLVCSSTYRWIVARDTPQKTKGRAREVSGATIEVTANHR
jgi:hypothetical protein